MKSIGFTNFRRFEKLESLPLGKITFFVGGNNAGKSTVVKAMMLMLDNIFSDRRISRREEELSSPIFRLDANRIHEVHIGTFGRALHRPYPEVKKITLEADIDDFHIRYTITGDTESKKADAEVVKIEILDSINEVQYVFDFHQNKASVAYNTAILKKFAGRFDYRSPFGYFSRQSPLPSDLDQQNEEHIFSWNVEKKQIKKAISNTTDMMKVAQLNSSLENIENLLKKYKQKNDPFNGNLKIEDKIFTCTIRNEDNNRATPLSMTNLLDCIVRDVVPQEMYHRGLEETDQTSRQSKEKEAFVSMVSSTSQRFRFRLHRSAIEYIAAHAISQDVIYKNDYMASVMRDFLSQRITPSSREERFIQDWLRKLNIGLDYQIEPISGEAYTMSITNMQGETIPLADLGMGSIQMVILLLKLATIMASQRGSGCIIIIEEPEQNIHPKLQSRLADLFTTVNRKYGFRFVIETHSEYIIRRTQAMIATGEVNYENNPFMVYYFPENGEPYDMEYQESGRFKKSFGEGFFDEAAKWTSEMAVKELQNQPKTDFIWEKIR